MTTYSSPLVLSRASNAWSFCAIGLTCLLNLQQEIKDLLVFPQPFLRRQP